MRIIWLVLASVLLSTTGQLLLRSGMREHGHKLTACALSPSAWLHAMTSYRVALGLLAWCAATIIWLLSLARAPLSYVYGLASINYVIVPVASWAILGETTSRQQVLGMVIILSGVIIIAFARSTGAPHACP